MSRSPVLSQTSEQPGRRPFARELNRVFNHLLPIKVCKQTSTGLKVPTRKKRCPRKLTWNSVSRSPSRAQKNGLVTTSHHRTATNEEPETLTASQRQRGYAYETTVIENATRKALKRCRYALQPAYRRLQYRGSRSVALFLGTRRTLIVASHRFLSQHRRDADRFFELR